MKKVSFFAVITAIMLFSFTLSHESRAENSDPNPPATVATSAAALPTVDSAENLRQLLAEAEKLNSRHYYGFSVDLGMPLAESESLLASSFKRF